MGLARRLVRVGCMVEFWGSERGRGLASSHGFEYRLIEGVVSRYPPSLEQFYGRTGGIAAWEEYRVRRDLAAGLREALNSAGAAVNAAILSFRPDLVIFDPFLLAYYPFIAIHGVPCVVLSTKPLIDRQSSGPPYTSRAVPKRGILWTAMNHVHWSVSRVRYNAHLARERLWGAVGAYSHEALISAVALRASYPLSARRVHRPITFDLHFRGLLEWVMWTPEMDFPRFRALPASARFVGTCVDVGRVEPESGAVNEWIAANRRRFLVYVSFGTIRQDDPASQALLNAVVAAFGQDPAITLVVASGTPDVAQDLLRRMGNADSSLVAHWLPQLDVIRHADLVVTHGGAGTYRECVIHGVPMLVYPRSGDQFGNAARITVNEVGLAGKRCTATAESIRRDGTRVLSDPRFKVNILKLRRLALAYESDGLLASLLNEAIGVSMG